MTITIYGHTLPVDDLDHAERIRAKANEIEAEYGEGADELYRWLYAGAPLDGLDWK